MSRPDIYFGVLICAGLHVTKERWQTFTCHRKLGAIVTNNHGRLRAFTCHVQTGLQDVLESRAEGATARGFSSFCEESQRQRPLPSRPAQKQVHVANC